MIVSRVEIAAADEQSGIEMGFDTRRVSALRPLAFVVGRVEHQLCKAVLQQHPVEEFFAIFDRIRRRAADNLKAKDVAVKAHRRRHIENLQQRAETGEFHGHRLHLPREVGAVDSHAKAHKVLALRPVVLGCYIPFPGGLRSASCLPLRREITPQNEIMAGYGF